MLLPYRCYLLLRRNVINRRSFQMPVFSKSSKILGIETSCDDTGCAVVDGVGNLLGETLYSQNALHVKYGGINPVVAHELHRESIEPAVTGALKKSCVSINDITAIAVTTKPGILISLQVGVKYARHLAIKYQKPLIPIHHMEAHALVVRMYQDVQFPYLVVLISGGHCLIALVRNTMDFLLLGGSLDNAPGEVMDKAARRMKLKNIREYAHLPGGQAIEKAAEKAKNPDMFEFPLPLARTRDCNFSFSGLKDSLIRKLLQKEKEHNIIGCQLIPEVNDLCAAFQLAIAEHLMHRVERAALFCEQTKLIKDRKTIVVSGGVACNNFIFESLKALGDRLGYSVIRPPARVCTDNGVMIAWNGIEKLKVQEGIVSDISMKDIDPASVLGKSIVDKVRAADLHTKVTRLKKYQET